MIRSKKVVLKQILIVTLLTLAGAPPVHAQGGGTAANYPNKPIRWVTGGGPDAMARILGQKFTEAWGQQIVIEERGGGGGMMSADLVCVPMATRYCLRPARTLSAPTISRRVITWSAISRR